MLEHPAEPVPLKTETSTPFSEVATSNGFSKAEVQIQDGPSTRTASQAGLPRGN